MPHEVLEDPNKTAASWFTYDQFEIFYWLSPRAEYPVWNEAACTLFYKAGVVCGVLAMIGGLPGMNMGFEFAAIWVLGLYAFRFLSFVQFFTNHNYLFLLLGFLLLLSGGGSYFPPEYYNDILDEVGAADSKSSYNNNHSKNNSVNETPKQRAQRRLRSLIQRSEWGVILIRLQYAIVYFFASIWKITPDWVDGTICKTIFTTFEDQGVHRGVPWTKLYGEYGMPLFRLVAIGGLLLDTGMLLALTFRRPNHKSKKLFMALSVVFHGFVCFTMSQRIGYMFPLCCLAGSLVFQPIGNDDHDGDGTEKRKQEEEYAHCKKDDDYRANNNEDTEMKSGTVHTPTTIDTKSGPTDCDEANLIGWIYRYATGSKKARASLRQRCFALFWFLFQMGMPLRMPIISKGTFPHTSQGYRFSWTMMLHSRFQMIVRETEIPLPDGNAQQYILVMDLMQLFPLCADVVPILRSAYSPSPKSLIPTADPRTIPMVGGSFGGGILHMRQRAMIEQFPRHVARVAGGWSDRVFTANPKACINTQNNYTKPISVYGVHFSKLNGKGPFSRLFDPTINLAEAEVARKKRSLWEMIRGTVLDEGPPGFEYLLSKGVGSMSSKAMHHKADLETKYPHIKQIEFIADRARCLSARPFSLWPNNFPLAVVALEMPEHFNLKLYRRQLQENTPPDKQWEGLSDFTTTDLMLDKVEDASATMIEFKAKRDGYGKISIQSCGETEEEDILFALLFLA